MSPFLGKLRKQTGQIRLYAVAIGKWTVVSFLIGCLCGGLGSAFHVGVEWVTLLRLTHRWLVWLLPLSGIAIAATYHLLGVDGHSTNNIISEVQSGEGLKLNLIPAIFVSTLLTHLCGGSAGREGAALQMGGTLGYEVGKLFSLDERDIRTATIAGMAGFFSALFGTPLAAAIFAMAVISVGLLYHAALIPSLFSSLTAYGISRMFGIAPAHYTVSAPEIEIFMFFKVVLLAALCALVSSLFCDVLHHMESAMRKWFPNNLLRAVAGGFALIALSLLFPVDYNGTGTGIIRLAIEEGSAHPLAFLLKILFTSVTLSAGFKGGEVVPSFFIGSTFGCVAGPLLGIPSGFAAAVGLIAVFCGAVNCPIASTFLAIELFGADGVLYYAMACAVSFVLSGYNGLYSSQRILYDKLKAQFIDVHANAYREGEKPLEAIPVPTSKTDTENTPTHGT